MVLLVTAGEYPLYIERGATFVRRFTWNTTDINGNTVPVDLTGCVARAQIRPKAGAPTLLVDFSTDGTIAIPSPTEGYVDLYLSDETTTQIEAKKGRWDLEIAWATGEVTRLLEGEVEFSAEVTVPATP